MMEQISERAIQPSAGNELRWDCGCRFRLDGEAPETIRMIPCNVHERFGAAERGMLLLEARRQIGVKA